MKRIVFLLLLIMLFFFPIFGEKEHYDSVDKKLLLKKFTNEELSLLQLVDKRHSLSEKYMPPDLVEIPKTIKKYYKSMKIRKVVLQSLMKMVNDARKDGVILSIRSAYRSYTYQKNIYENVIKKYGKEFAEKYVAFPGNSQHQLGTAIDFNSLEVSFEKTKTAKWLFKNAYKYGFSLSYPKGKEKITGYHYEPWHYRYIGVKAATICHNHFNGIQQQFLEFVNKYYGNNK